MCGSPPRNARRKKHLRKQNHAFAPAPLKNIQKRVNAPRVYQARALKGAAQSGETAASTARILRDERTEVSPSNQAFRRRQPAEKRAKEKTLAQAKPRFCARAPHLPHTCGSCGKSEFARRFIISVPLNAAQREKTRRRAAFQAANVGFFLKSRQFAAAVAARIV